MVLAEFQLSPNNVMVFVDQFYKQSNNNAKHDVFKFVVLSF